MKPADLSGVELMPKSNKKAPARVTPKLTPSLPPEVLEQAAQGWLQSHGISSTPAAPKQGEPSFSQLSESLDKVLHQLRAELDDLRNRISRLESKKS
jgi:hypothetical protein